jgi:hypothetical protein
MQILLVAQALACRVETSGIRLGGAGLGWRPAGTPHLPFGPADPLLGLLAAPSA